MPTLSLGADLCKKSVEDTLDKDFKTEKGCENGDDNVEPRSAWPDAGAAL
jgi:hypothetical protein